MAQEKVASAAGGATEKERSAYSLVRVFIYVSNQCQSRICLRVRRHVDVLNKSFRQRHCRRPP